MRLHERPQGPAIVSGMVYVNTGYTNAMAGMCCWRFSIASQMRMAHGDHSRGYRGFLLHAFRAYRKPQLAIMRERFGVGKGDALVLNVDTNERPHHRP